MTKHLDDGAKLLKTRESLRPSVQVESPVFERVRAGISLGGGERQRT